MVLIWLKKNLNNHTCSSSPLSKDGNRTSEVRGCMMLWFRSFPQIIAESELSSSSSMLMTSMFSPKFLTEVFVKKWLSKSLLFLVLVELACLSSDAVFRFDEVFSVSLWVPECKVFWLTSKLSETWNKYSNHFFSNCWEH